MKNNLLFPLNGFKLDGKTFKIEVPQKIEFEPSHFPEGFPPDYPALFTDKYVREVLAIANESDERFNVFIRLNDFLEGRFEWLPFTLALHTVVLAPQARVYFYGMSIVNYSDSIDARNPRGPMRCLHNLCIYLDTTKGDRPGRIYDQTPSGDFLSFDEEIFPMSRSMGSYFSPYYNYWLVNPYHTAPGAEMYGMPDYVTHPYDHLPVRNRSNNLKLGYFTERQWKEKGYSVPGIDKAVFLHDQLDTVRLRPYWSSMNVFKAQRRFAKI